MRLSSARPSRSGLLQSVLFYYSWSSQSALQTNLQSTSPSSVDADCSARWRVAGLSLCRVKAARLDAAKAPASSLWVLSKKPESSCRASIPCRFAEFSLQVCCRDKHLLVSKVTQLVKWRPLLWAVPLQTMRACWPFQATDLCSQMLWRNPVSSCTNLLHKETQVREKLVF
jgi:hypothetical protein